MSVGEAQIIGGVFAGLFAGFVGSMLGLGGGFIMVPILHLSIAIPILCLNLGFGLDIKTAVGTSLAIMIFTATSSAYRYWRHGRIDTGLAKYLVVTSVPGVVAGAMIGHIVDRNTLKIVFAAALGLAAIRMFMGKKELARHGFKKHVVQRRLVDREGTVFEYNVNLVLTMIFAGVAGVSAGLLGIGGGIINVPVLTFSGLPIHLAVATSSFLIIFNASTGAVSHGILGNIDYGMTAVIVPGVIVGAQFGAIAGKRVKPKKLQLILACALVLLALRMIAKAMGWWV